jgi:hypothetical protein
MLESVQRPEIGSRIAAIMASANFVPLIDRLRHYVAAERGEADFLVDPEGLVLSDIVLRAGMVYEGVQLSDDAASKSTFHELAAPPLASVMEWLRDDANYSDVLVALGAPAMLALSPDQAAVSRAGERHEALLHALDDIARAVPPPPAKRDRGRPSNPKDLRFMVGWLADRWEAHTGHPPTQSWREGKPVPGEARFAWFVYDVVEFIDPERLGELLKVTAKIVTDWRAGQRDSWWRERTLRVPMATSRK